MSRGNSVACRQCGNLRAAAAKEEGVGRDEEGIQALPHKGGKSRTNFVARAGVEDMDLQPDNVGGFLHLVQCRLGSATRTALGTSSCRSSSRLATTSRSKKLTPVALPPGRARLATRPSLTGSSPALKTIGIVAVAALAASAATTPSAAITATRRRTKSAINAGKRSSWPS